MIYVSIPFVLVGLLMALFQWRLNAVRAGDPYGPNDRMAAGISLGCFILAATIAAQAF
jgi:hypothetical protein